MAKTYNARKRKVKKNIPHGQVHIHTTFNNTVITIKNEPSSTQQKKKIPCLDSLKLRHFFPPLILLSLLFHNHSNVHLSAST